MIMFEKISPNFTKSPLGVIALFIVLVYGIATTPTLFGNFDKCQLWLLLGFLVTFPFVVLGVFYRLVTKYPKNIYGPENFKSDQAFHTYTGAAEEQKTNYEQELLAWVNQSKLNRLALRQWLKQNNIQHSVTLFLNGGSPGLVATARDELVPADFQLPPGADNGNEQG